MMTMIQMTTVTVFKSFTPFSENTPMSWKPQDRTSEGSRIVSNEHDLTHQGLTHSKKSSSVSAAAAND